MAMSPAGPIEKHAYADEDHQQLSRTELKLVFEVRLEAAGCD